MNARATNRLIVALFSAAFAGCAADGRTFVVQEDAYSPITSGSSQNRFFNVGVPEYRISVLRIEKPDKPVIFHVTAMNQAGHEGINAWIHPTGFEVLGDKEGDLRLVTDSSPGLGEHLAIMHLGKRLLAIKRNGDIE